MAIKHEAPVTTNILLQHSELRLRLHGNEAAWVRSISGSVDDPIISVGLGTVTMFGQLEVVRERLAALVSVIDDAVAQPDRWPQIGLRRVDEHHWTRDSPNPFVDLGHGPADPEPSHPAR